MGVPNTLGTQCVNRLPAFFLWSGIPTVFFKTLTRFPRFFQPVFKWRKGPRYIRISSSYSASGAIILQWRMGITQKNGPPSRHQQGVPPQIFVSNDMLFFENMRPKWCGEWIWAMVSYVGTGEHLDVPDSQTKAPKRSLWWYNVDGIFERNSEQPRFRGCIRQPICIYIYIYEIWIEMQT